jgi:hypothetical protein
VKSCKKNIGRAPAQRVEIKLHDNKVIMPTTACDPLHTKSFTGSVDDYRVPEVLEGAVFTYQACAVEQAPSDTLGDVLVRMTDGQITLSSRTYCLDPGECFVRALSMKKSPDERPASQSPPARVRSTTIRRSHRLVSIGLYLLAAIAVVPIVGTYKGRVGSAQRRGRL